MAFMIERKNTPAFGIKASAMKPMDIGVIIRSDDYQSVLGHYVFMTYGILVSLTTGSYWDRKNDLLDEMVVNVLTGVELTLRID